MRNPIRSVATFFVVLLPSALFSQNNESIATVRAAAVFLRDSLPAQRIVIDNEFMRSLTSISSADADEVARLVGAKRGRLAEVLQCGKDKRCVAKTKEVVVVAFSQPVIQNNSAEIRVFWAYTVNEHLVGTTATLTLVRASGHSWRVRGMRHTGQS